MRTAHCLKIRGGSDGYLETDVGADIHPDVTSLILDYFESPRGVYDYEGRLLTDAHPDFVSELRTRQFDLSTFRFEVYMLGTKKIPQKPGFVEGRDGCLYTRWGRVEYSDPDVCSTWSYPATRQDSALWVNVMIGPAVTKSHFEYQQRQRYGSYKGGLIELLKQFHLDERTMRMQVRHSLYQPE